jgi:hypothetical protein
MLYFNQEICIIIIIIIIILVTYVDFISPSQRQADAIYFDLSNAFELVPHSLLLHNLSVLGILMGM